jgi:hypothetical protein
MHHLNRQRNSHHGSLVFSLFHQPRKRFGIRVRSRGSPFKRQPLPTPNAMANIKRKYKTAEMDEGRKRVLPIGRDLYMDGQTRGRTDNFVIEHRERGLGLLLFLSGGEITVSMGSISFRGSIRIRLYSGAKPTQFHLTRCESASRK